MPIVHDDVLGEVVVRRVKSARAIRIKYAANGKYTATIPTLTPIFYLKKMLRESRNELLGLAETTAPDMYEDGQIIGLDHKIAIVRSGISDRPHVKTTRKTIVVTLPPTTDVKNIEVQGMIRVEVTKVLRTVAKGYLPNRLKLLAAKGPFTYTKVRFSHASGRWGSCSSNGTISLNIALMKLSPQLIDYVLIHELAHTREMNHSPSFWSIVGQYDPLYKLHRRQMKHYTPHL